jgi:hypothetical protein
MWFRNTEKYIWQEKLENVPGIRRIFFCLTRKKCTTKGKIFFPGLG